MGQLAPNPRHSREPRINLNLRPMIKDGRYFKQTLAALKLDAEQAADATRNADEIVAAIMRAYGLKPDGKIDPSKSPKSLVTGLVYGRIQSGKTRAMIASTAMAFDNQFRVAVVMTSNINDLVDQTHIDFSYGLPDIMTLTKDSALDHEVPGARVYLEKGAGCLLLICSKGAGSLRNIAKFLRNVGATNYPSIIFDDEGDQASLDTHTRKRSRSAILVAPSPINSAIQTKLRAAIPKHVYVSVTGTPQAILLQSAESSHRPSFIVMLPPGKSYVGGEQFFRAGLPEDSPELIGLVDADEKAKLLDADADMPDGLRSAILFFLVAGGAAIAKLGLTDHGYSFLCHPSLRNDEQATAEERIIAFLAAVLHALYEPTSEPKIWEGLNVAYKDLTATLEEPPSFDNVVDQLKRYLPGRRLLVINARVKRQGIAYGNGLNFLIGGNTLGRGIAIRQLLVTYYVRDSRVSQLDTMHQHARMYGYRRKTLQYTRIFVPRHLYFRFRDIHESDEELRSFIELHKADPSTFPVEYSFGLRPTRTGVLDVKKTDTLNPNKQVYPNYVVLPQGEDRYAKVLNQLRVLLDCPNCTEEQLQEQNKSISITAAQAAALVAPIKTRSQNTWRDGTIPIVFERVAGSFGGQIFLRFRTAGRTVRENGYIETGILFGDVLSAARAAQRPTLWIFSTTALPGSAVGAGSKFMYPTFVIPASFPKLIMFNRGT